MPVYNEKNKNKWTKDGRHYYYACYYTDMYGNTKKKISKMYLTSAIAKNEELDFLSKVKTSDLSDYNISFMSVYEEWKQHKINLVKCTSYYNIVKTLNKHVIPIFEKFKLHSIKIPNIIQWKDYLKKTGISLNTQNKVIGYFREILDYANENYDFDKKVLNKLQKYKISTSSQINNSETNFWTYDEFNKFISIVDDEFYNILFTFLYMTGLRIGELQALKWIDYNSKNKTLRINKSLTTNIFDVSYAIVDPKTSNSFRIVDIDDNVCCLLDKLKNKSKLLYGFNEQFYIFGDVSHIGLTTIRRYLNKYIAIANVKKITLHGFRHSHVSLLIYLGCDSRDVAERIGDTVSVLEDTYYHMFPDKKSRTISALNSLPTKNSR